MRANDRPQVPLRDVAVEDRHQVVVEPVGRYPIAGVRIAGLGLFKRETLAGADTKYAKLYRLSADQLVYRKLTAWEGPITIVPQEFDGTFVSGEFPTFTLDRERIEPAYLELFCRQPLFHAAMRRGSTGTAERRNRLKPEELLSIPITLPSLPEQRRIVTACDAARIYRDACETEHAATFALLAAAWQRQWEELKLEGAPVRPIGEACEVLIGATPSRRRPEYFDGGHIRWLKTGEIRFNDINDTGEKLTDEGFSKSSTKLIPAGSCVMAMKGQGATRGRVALTTAPMTTNEACAAFLASDEVQPRYLFHWFWSQYRQTREIGDGTSQPNLNSSMIRELEVLLPDPPDQQLAVAQLDRFLDRHRAAADETAAASRVESVLTHRLITRGLA